MTDRAILAAIITDTRDWFRRHPHGWCQRATRRTTPEGWAQRCLLQGLQDAAYLRTPLNGTDRPLAYFDAAVAAAKGAMSPHAIRHYGGKLIPWHDAPDRTRADVIRLLDATLADLQQ